MLVAVDGWWGCYGSEKSLIFVLWLQPQFKCTPLVKWSLSSSCIIETCSFYVLLKKQQHACLKRFAFVKTSILSEGSKTGNVWAATKNKQPTNTVSFIRYYVCCNSLGSCQEQCRKSLNGTRSFYSASYLITYYPSDQDQFFCSCFFIHELTERDHVTKILHLNMSVV